MFFVLSAPQLLREAQQTALAGAVEMASAAAAVPVASGLVAAAGPDAAPQPAPLLTASEVLEGLTPSKVPIVRAVAAMLQPVTEELAVLKKNSIAGHSLTLQVCSALAVIEATSANTAVLCRTALEQAAPLPPSAPGPSAPAAAAAGGFFAERSKGTIRKEERRELLAKAKAAFVAPALQEPVPASLLNAAPDANGSQALALGDPLRSSGGVACEHQLP